MMKNLVYMNAKNGDKIIKIDNYLLHSKYNPRIEARRFVEENIEKNCKNIVIGLGLGYIIPELENENYDMEDILIIEPLSELQGQIKSKYKIMYGVNEQEIKVEVSKLLKYFNREVKVIVLTPYKTIFSNECKRILNVIKEVQMLNVVNDNTIRGQSVFWQENIIKNTLYATLGNSLADLRNYYTAPVVIASGGPSLMKQIPLLKKYRNKMILLAAGSTLTTLVKEGVKPNYVISIDGTPGNYELHFKGFDYEGIELIYLFSNNYLIQKNYNEQHYYFIDKYDESLKNSLEIRYYFNDIAKIEGGGSVANYALSVARFITTGPVAMIGQDLAYTNNETHSKHNLGRKIVTEDLLKERGAIKIDGYFNEKVWSDYSLISMKQSFEKILKSIAFPETIFNCTEGGARIKGMEQVPFKSFCDLYLNKEVPLLKVNKTFEYQRLKGLKENYQREIDVYNELISELENLIVRLKDIKIKGYFSNSDLKCLENFDTKFLEKQKEVFLELIIEPIILDIMKDVELTDLSFVTTYNQSEKLYTELMNVIEISRNYTLEVLSELDMMEGYR